MRLGRAAKAAGITDKADRRVHRASSTNSRSAISRRSASAELDEPADAGRLPPGTNRYKLELGRAERLFGAKRYSRRGSAFEGAAQRGARATIASSSTLRLAECDYFLKRARNARDGVKPYIDKARARAKRCFLRGRVARSRRPRRIPAHRPAAGRRVPDSELGGRSAQQPRDALHPAERRRSAPTQTFREMYQKFPTGHYAERAAWKIGWCAYKAGRYADAIARVRVGGRAFPALRLPAVVALLVGPRARGAERAGDRRASATRSSPPTI